MKGRIPDHSEYVKLVSNDNPHTEQHLAINCSYAFETLAAYKKAALHILL
jgi:hypothetical protein